MVMCKCDKCGAEIKSIADIKKFYMYSEGNDSVLERIRDMDFCENCFDELYTRVMDFISFKEQSNG